MSENSNETPVQSTETKTAEYNFQQLRKQLENERYAREQAEIRAKQLEEERERINSKHKEVEEESYDDPYIDEKRLEKRLKSWESNLDERIDKKAEQKARFLLEQERQNNFLKENKDFNDIMSPEMLQKFADTYPDVVEGILEMPDDFNRKKHVYKTIKSLKLHKKPEDDKLEEQIQNNRKRGLYQPSGMAASPYQGGGDFSKSGQEQAYKQMQELASRFGGQGVKGP